MRPNEYLTCMNVRHSHIAELSLSLSLVGVALPQREVARKELVRIYRADYSCAYRQFHPSVRPSICPCFAFRLKGKYRLRENTTDPQNPSRIYETSFPKYCRIVKQQISRIFRTSFRKNSRKTQRFPLSYALARYVSSHPPLSIVEFAHCLGIYERSNSRSFLVFQAN